MSFYSCVIPFAGGRVTKQNGRRKDKNVANFEDPPVSLLDCKTNLALNEY